jgi:hypothetical protein
MPGMGFSLSFANSYTRRLLIRNIPAPSGAVKISLMLLPSWIRPNKFFLRALYLTNEDSYQMSVDQVEATYV